MEINPLDDALPPRYAIESDDEDEYNPLTAQRADQVPIVNIKIEGQFATGCPLVIASGPAGDFWASGADLGEQQGAIFVNNIQVGLLFKPSSTRAVVLVSEATAVLPLGSMNKYVNDILDRLQPSGISILDVYSIQSYISSEPLPVHEAPVRYLSLQNTSLNPFQKFLPPNILQSTSAAFMSAMNTRALSYSHQINAIILLLPSPEIPRTTVSKLSTSRLSRPSEDQAWYVEMMVEVDEKLFGMVGAERSGTWALKSTPAGSAFSLSKKRQELAELGEGSMYI